MRMDKRSFLNLFVVFLAGCPSVARSLDRMNHVVIVMEENYSYDDFLKNGEKKTPYLSHLAQTQLFMTDFHAESHPSLPNYLALFSGSTQNVTDDECDHFFSTTQLADELLKAGFSFSAYSEDLPSEGSTVCNAGGADGYYKKHCPWVYWQEKGTFSAALSQPYSAFPKGPDYSALPDVSFVIPSVAHDMHAPNGFPPAADKWLKKNMDGFCKWAKKNNSLLIVTWDEDDDGPDNHIPTIFAGAIKPGKYPAKVNHYNILRTIEEMFGLKPLGESEGAEPIKDIFAPK